MATERGTVNNPFPKLSYRFIPDFIAWAFGYYGLLIGLYPKTVIIVGLIPAFVGAAGLYRINVPTDADSLVDQFFATGSRFDSDAVVINQWTNVSRTSNPIRSLPFFKPNPHRNYTQDDPCLGSYAEWRIESVIVTAKDGGNLLNLESIYDILEISDYVRSILDCGAKCCDVWDLERIRSEIDSQLDPQDLLQILSQITYPKLEIPDFLKDSFPMLPTPTTFTNLLGGVSVEDPSNLYNSKIVGVKAMMFQYFMPPDSDTKGKEKNLRQQLPSMDDNLGVNADFQTYMQLQEEFFDIIFREIPKILVAFLCVIAWVFIGAIHTDILNSKSWFAMIGISCTGLACLAGFGVRFWFGDNFYSYIIPVPLMALGKY